MPLEVIIPGALLGAMLGGFLAWGSHTSGRESVVSVSGGNVMPEWMQRLHSTPFSTSVSHDQRTGIWTVILVDARGNKFMRQSERVDWAVDWALKAAAESFAPTPNPPAPTPAEDAGQ